MKAENNRRQEETSNNLCEILACDTQVSSSKHININHPRISPSVL